MDDTETLNSNKKQKGNKYNTDDVSGDFPSIGIDLLKKTNFKIAIFLFLIGIFIFSDIFIENFLPKNNVDGYCADSKGTMIQLLVFVLLYLVIDLLVQGCLI